MTIDCDPSIQKLIVRVDRSRVVTHGKPALGRMLLKLHMYRCTADVKACRSYYEGLSRVDGDYLEWRKIVLAKQQPKWAFVQANTFLEGGEVRLREYEPTKEGVIQSWVERAV
jgi:dipeptidyl-peptidase-3